MPLNIPNNLPAFDALKKENIFTMQEDIAIHQDIRPLKIVILNLMPIKAETELHLLRMLSNNPLQIEITLIHPHTHVSHNTPKEHLELFYKTFYDIKQDCFDGLIITGAPVEKLEFEDVDYWNELVEIMDWAKTNVTSTLYICWAALAGLYYHYGIPKQVLDNKIFGVFKHRVHFPQTPLVRGFDDEFLAPHSRHSTAKIEDINRIPELLVLAEADEAGAHIIIDKSGKSIFVTGHGEYDPLTLKREYDRDVKKGQAIEVPKNYFPNDDPLKDPVIRWTSHANLMYSNWLNYYVYQMTSYDWVSHKIIKS